MADQAIFNSSPLISLSNAGYAQLVRAAAEHLIVPMAVVHELQQRGENDPAVVLVCSLRGWERVSRRCWRLRKFALARS